MSRRHISTDWKAPDEELVNIIYSSEPISLEAVPEELPTPTPNSKTPRKKTKDKKTNETERVRNVSVGCGTSDEETGTAPEKINDKPPEEVWVKVSYLHSQLQ